VLFFSGLFESGADLIQSLRETNRLNWLEQIIKRVCFERADGVFVKGCCEDDQRWMPQLRNNE